MGRGQNKTTTDRRLNRPSFHFTRVTHLGYLFLDPQPCVLCASYCWNMCEAVQVGWSRLAKLCFVLLVVCFLLYVVLK